MSIHFPRSIDSLRANRVRPIYSLLAFAAVLLAIWVYWFLDAKIARYENGRILQTMQDGSVLAVFADEAFDRLQLDQPAWLHVQDAAGNEVEAIPATVVTLPDELPASGTGGQFQVELYSELDEENEEDFADGFTGDVVVEIGYLSPFALLLEQLN